MIRFRDKPKVKPANAKPSATDAAAAAAPKSAAAVDIAKAAAPAAKTEPEKSDAVKN